DAVTPNHRAARFHHLGKSARQDLLKNREITFFWKAHQSEGRERTPAHSVDIAERVRGGNLTEGEWVVDDGREKINRLHQRRFRPDLIHARVVGVIEADQNLRVMLPG